MAVAGPGRSLRMVLHREGPAVLERQPAIRAIEQRDMRLHRMAGQRRAIDREAVVHRRDLDLAGREILHRVIGAVMALMHFHGLGADREREHLMAEADAEYRLVCPPAPGTRGPAYAPTALG